MIYNLDEFYYSPWLYMTLTTDNNLVPKEGTSQITINFNKAYDGCTTQNLDPNNGHLSDGTIIKFSTTFGNVSANSSTQSGVASSTFSGGLLSGTADVSAVLDDQILHTLVKIDAIAPTATISTKAGSYNAIKNVTIQSSEPGKIYYTINGTTPTISSSVYKDPLIIISNTVLKYFAMDLAGNPSPVKTETITINNGFLEEFNNYDSYNKIANSTSKYSIKWDRTFGHPNSSLKISYGSRTGSASCTLYQSEEGYDAKVYPLLNIGYFSGGLGAKYPINGNFKIDMYRAGETADDAKSYVIHFSGNKPTAVALPQNQIRWAYMAYDLNQEDFTRLSKSGFTDVCYLVGNIMDDYDNCVKKANTFARYAKNVGLRFHAGIFEFRKTDRTYYNPAYIDSDPSPLITALNRFINDCPDISGISFDDFVYPKVFYNKDNDEIQREHLRSIARRSYAAVHKTGICFSIAMYQARSAHMEEIAPYCDLLLPENTHRYNITSSSFLYDQTKKALTWAGDCKILPAIATYRDNLDHAGTMWTEDFLQDDINTVNSLNPFGYSLWVYPYIPMPIYRQEIPIADIKTSFNGKWQNVVIDLGKLFDQKFSSTEYHVIRLAFEGTITSDDLDHSPESAIWFDQINAQSRPSTSTEENPYYNFQEDDPSSWILQDGISYFENSCPLAYSNTKGGIYNTTKKVTLTMNKPGTIYYTLDYSDPTTSSNVYTNPITITTSTVLKFIAVDLKGNPSIIYNVSYCIDKIAPTIFDIDPLKGSSDVLSNRDIKITFNEHVKFGVNPRIELIYRGKVTPITTYINDNIITVNPASRLTNGKYTLILYPGSLTDLAGNSIAMYSSNFIVNDTTPEVLFTIPSNFRTNITLSSGIAVKFNKYIEKSTNFYGIKIKNLTNNTYLTSTKAIKGSTLYIVTAKRRTDTWHQVIIPYLAVKDDANNNLKATYTFKFKTTE